MSRRCSRWSRIRLNYLKFELTDVIMKMSSCGVISWYLMIWSWGVWSEPNPMEPNFLWRWKSRRCTGTTNDTNVLVFIFSRWRLSKNVDVIERRHICMYFALESILLFVIKQVAADSKRHGPDQKNRDWPFCYFLVICMLMKSPITLDVNISMGRLGLF